MARTRNVRPEFFTDEKTSSLSFGAMLLFIGCWQQCDLRGVFEYNPRQLKSAIFPSQDSVTLERVTQWLAEAVSLGLVVCFQHGGKHYGHVINFTKHQAISTNERKGGPKYPSPTIANRKPAPESKPETSSQPPESTPVAGDEKVIPESDDGQTKVVPGSALHRTQDGGHRTEDTGGADLFGHSKQDPQDIDSRDRWPYVQSEPWAKALKDAVKIGPGTWVRWKEIVDSGWTTKQIIEAARTLPMLKRWPDDVDAILREGARDPQPDHSVAERSPLDQARAIVRSIGWERARDLLGVKAARPERLDELLEHRDDLPGKLIAAAKSKGAA